MQIFILLLSSAITWVYFGYALEEVLSKSPQQLVNWSYFHEIMRKTPTSCLKCDYKRPKLHNENANYAGSESHSLISCVNKADDYLLTSNFEYNITQFLRALFIFHMPNVLNTSLLSMRILYNINVYKKHEAEIRQKL